MTCEAVVMGLGFIVVFFGVSLFHTGRKLQRAEERVEELSRTLESVAANYQILPLMKKDEE